MWGRNRVLGTLLCGVAMVGGEEAAQAQTAPSNALPPVLVAPPAERARPRARPAPRQAAGPAIRRPRAAVRRVVPVQPVASPAAAAEGSQQGVVPERATGPVNGFVATRSATGTKTDTPLIRTPQSISVVTQDLIKATGAQNPSEALRYTAGVQGERFGNDPRYDWIRVRGFDSPEYLDGLQLPKGLYAWPRYEPFGLERIEVLKGPGSVLYGQTPPGGIVNQVSKRPLDVPYNEVRIQGGSYGRLQAAFDTTGPATADGTLLYRVVGLGRISDTIVDFVNDDRAFIAPSFTWRPTERTTFTFLSHYIKDDSKALQFLPSQGVFRPNPNGRIPRSRFLGEPTYDNFDRRQFGVGYEFEHRFDEGVTVRQNLRYAGVDVALPVLRGFGFPGPVGAPTSLVNVTRRAVRFDDEVNAFTIDNQVQWNTVTGPLAHTILGGVDYRNFDRASTTLNGVAPALNVFAPVYGLPFANPPLTLSNVQNLSQVGLYLQDQVRLDRLVVMLSGRYDDVSNFNRNRITNARFTQDDDRFTYRAGLLYELPHGISPFVAYSTSFFPSVGISSAGFDPAFGTTRAGQPFRPTTGEQIEGGVKYQPPGIPAFFTATGFSIEQSNVLVPDLASVGFQTQLGRVSAHGAEFEAKFGPFAGFEGVLSYTYFDSEITRGNATLIGKQLIFAPHNQFAAFGTYTIGDGALRGLGFGGGVRFFGDAFGDQNNTLKIPSYTLLDALVRYDLGAAHPSLKGAEIAVNVSNLLDERYVSTCGDLNTCYYGNPRQVLATLSYRW